MASSLFHNTISSITVSHITVAQLGSATQVGIKLERISPPLIQAKIHEDEGFIREGGPPPRNASALPASGSIEMHLEATRLIGRGGSGCIYAVTPSDIRGPAGSEAIHPPPLVIKIAQGSEDCKLLTSEASMYEELEWVQGAIVPHCYGLFMGELEEGLILRHTPEQCDDKMFQFYLQTRPVDREPRRIAVLVLEELGKPLGKDNFKGRDTRDEIRDMLNDLARLGVIHHDLQLDNILEAPAIPPGLPRLPSPLRDRTYGWQIIDWEYATKSGDLRCD
ncbi:hypothetical protein NLJ89_g5146 [Agrocybe chaxingu]|uniref:Protein kinase domain-containing protein n=1 Tax=Agrocybe chaxingu TaxID=84603 RepID=A0A9W8K0R7_9AGAR|nr:hypothetical protein NLJ89_g5146 [Agrocybe chaxingu]